MSQISIVY